MKGKLLFLGTGGSMGIPVVACNCSVCTSASTKNKRFRASALLTVENKKILIDAGPDFREQALNLGLKSIDGLILTHSHRDHTGGIDELRAFHRPIPCLASQATIDDVKASNAYIFQNQNPDKLLTSFDFHILKGDQGPVSFLDLHFHFITFEQGGTPVNGFRFGNLAFISDIRHYSEAIFDELEGVQTLVISALRNEPSALHFSIPEAITFSKRIGAKTTWFTHMAHEIDHEKTNRDLPEGFQLAYDGLEIEF